jgi:hypothetical protein
MLFPRSLILSSIPARLGRIGILTGCSLADRGDRAFRGGDRGMMVRVSFPSVVNSPLEYQTRTKEPAEIERGFERFSIDRPPKFR